MTYRPHQDSSQMAPRMLRPPRAPQPSQSPGPPGDLDPRGLPDPPGHSALVACCPHGTREMGRPGPGHIQAVGGGALGNGDWVPAGALTGKWKPNPSVRHTHRCGAWGHPRASTSPLVPSSICQRRTPRSRLHPYRCPTAPHSQRNHLHPPHKLPSHPDS